MSDEVNKEGVDTEPQPENKEPKFRRVIQPKDEKGNPIGQPHVYEADTQEELDNKMADAIANGTKKIRELTRQTKLEDPKPSSVPDGAEVDQQFPEFKSRELTTDERFELSQQFRDPEKVDQAFDRMFEARFGRKPQDVAKQQEESARFAKAVRAKETAEAWREENPDYFFCHENGIAMLQFIAKHKLDPTKKGNYDIAFRELSKDGLLTLKPQEEPVNETVTEPEARTEPKPETVAATRRPPTSSGMRRSNSSGSAPQTRKGPSAEELAMMTSEQLRKLYPNELRNAR